MVASGHRSTNVFLVAGTPAGDVALQPMAAAPTASREPTRIAVAENLAILTFLPDGSDERRIDLSSFREVRFPTWSPDGKTIAFEGIGPLPLPTSKEIWTVDLDGSNLRQVTSFAADQAMNNLTWSPDGRTFAYDWWYGPFANWHSLFLVDAATGQRIRNFDFHPTDPAWSPDSSRIAFVAPWGIRIISLDAATTVHVNDLRASSVD